MSKHGNCININNNLINGPGFIGNGGTPTIPTVPTAPTVPTGPGEENIGIFTTTPFITAPGGSGVPLETNQTLIGTAITHTEGEAEIILVEPGTYTVSYSANAFAMNGSTIALQIEQDGILVPGTYAEGTEVTLLAASGSLTVTTTPSVLTLVPPDFTIGTENVEVTVVKTA
ncbi:hypothetical protein [Geomicrobium sediminis]|uniref:BclA C-terminal domain-containing protein n=1 Tax=Geomicrobium sediminis TaxID=1347788 RepID=A0ABS2PAF4_9BACL|nr:hypothetical protein [Geomicrobium sediminis]MBM7632403.1 hypothetical protein [Geomicrobium sediminis]